MTKSLAASSDIMQNYLSELLTDDETAVSTKPVKTKVENKRLEKLLENVSEPSLKVYSKRDTISSEKSKTPEKISQTNPIKETVEASIHTRKSEGSISVAKQKSYRKGNFQAMFFDVAGLIIAVPLIELGGIHNTDKTTSLMGKPDWFKGVMLHREDKINVVDTALWVMPEKCNETLINSLNYQYVIMLGNSKWGLMAEHLVDTVTLQQDEVKWLDKPGKRPWLAGLVKERMCALLDVEALIKLLDDGAGII
ncbi:MAG: chemotaxis protein CheW [Colwellia sp.]|nr:chemotaxis protein CheW [Colwellia sp.]